jgi:sensor histidine kinase regulating citrate/malate metabolism
MVAIMVGAAVFALSNISFVIPNTLFGGVLGREIMSFRTVIDLVGIAMLYAHYAVCREYRAVREFTSLYGIVHTQNTYYQSYKDSLDLINRKYHDLKHQIIALRAERDEDKRRDFLDQMESEIKAFEAQNKTGNIVLDTILTTKALYCQSRGISLTVVADGAELNFMSTSDLASLFGNMLDNAVQSAEKLPDKERRLITLTVAHQKGFILIKTENYFEGDMVFADGLPKTTKFNTDYHGYGLKSIREIAKKYDGVMSINTEGNWFVLTLLFPEVGEEL